MQKPAVMVMAQKGFQNLGLRLRARRMSTRKSYPPETDRHFGMLALPSEACPPAVRQGYETTIYEYFVSGVKIQVRFVYGPLREP
jgi:hypothetical protein